MDMIDIYDVGQVYGEYILFWLLENVVDGHQIADFEIQEGSGLPDMEFHIGLNWLIRHNLLAPGEDVIH